MTEEKPVNVSGRLRHVFLEDFNRELVETQPLAVDASRDTSNVDIGQLALPNSTDRGGATWQATSPGPRGSKCDTVGSIC